MKVFIFEPDGSGHRFEYVAQVISALYKHNHEPVLLTTTKATRRVEFESHVGHAFVKIPNVILVDGPRETRWLRVLQLTRGHALIDLEADKRILRVAFSAILRLGPSRTVCLLMRPPWSTAATTKSKFKAASWDRIARLRRIRALVLGDCFGELSAYPPNPQRWTVIADKPVLHSRRLTREHDPALPMTILIGGLVDDRKAGVEIIGAISLVDNVILKIVGTVAPEVLSAVASLAPEVARRVLVVNRYVTDVELDEAVTQADVVSVILKTRVGSSGLLGRAVAYGIPVLAGGNETVSTAVSSRALGPIIADFSSESIAAAINEMSSNYDLFKTNAESSAIVTETRPSLGDALLGAVIADLR